MFLTYFVIPTTILCFSQSSNAQKNFTCFPGYFLGGNDTAACFRCNQGHRCNGFAEAECPRGTAQLIGGQETCNDCLRGYFQNATGQLRCKACPVGHFCPNSTDAPLPCPPGTFNSEMRRVEECEICAAGFFQPLEGQDHCLSCPVGHFCESPLSKPYKCPPGTKQPLPAQINCRNCPVGWFQSKAGQSSCQICPAGYECSDPSTLPTPCPLGRAQHLSGQSYCKPCPPGTYTSIVGQEKCLICPSAHFCSDPTLDPIACPPGQFQILDGQTECKPCAMGYYQNKEGQIKCIRCPPGHYCPWPEIGPVSCPPGSVQPNSAQIVCDICPEGQYKSMWKGIECSKCPPGHSCQKPYFCPKPCPVGTAQSSQESTTCIDCSVGNHTETIENDGFCPLPGNTVCGIDCKTLSVSCDRRLEMHLEDKLKFSENSSANQSVCGFYDEFQDICNTEDDSLASQLISKCEGSENIKFQNESSSYFLNRVQKCIQLYSSQPLQTGCQGLALGLHAYAICFQEMEFCNLEFGEKLKLFEAIGDFWWTAFSHGAPEYFSCFRGMLKYHINPGPKYPIVLGGNYSKFVW